MRPIGVALTDRNALALIVEIPDGEWRSINSHLRDSGGGPKGGLAIMFPPRGFLSSRVRCLDASGMPIYAGGSLHALDAGLTMKRGRKPGEVEIWDGTKLDASTTCEIGVRVEDRERNEKAEAFFCWTKPSDATSAKPGRCSSFAPAKPPSRLLSPQVDRLTLDGRSSLATSSVLLGSDNTASPPARRARLEMRLTLGEAPTLPIKVLTSVNCSGTLGKKEVSWWGKAQDSRSGWFEVGDVLVVKTPVDLQGPDDSAAEVSTCKIAVAAKLHTYKKPSEEPPFEDMGYACFGRENTDGPKSLGVLAIMDAKLVAGGEGCPSG